jgi:hypothetical protein
VGAEAPALALSSRRISAGALCFSWLSAYDASSGGLCLLTSSYIYPLQNSSAITPWRAASGSDAAAPAGRGRGRGRGRRFSVRRGAWTRDVSAAMCCTTVRPRLPSHRAHLPPAKKRHRARAASRPSIAPEHRARSSGQRDGRILRPGACDRQVAVRNGHGPHALARGLAKGQCSPSQRAYTAGWGRQTAAQRHRTRRAGCVLGAPFPRSLSLSSPAASLVTVKSTSFLSALIDSRPRSTKLVDQLLGRARTHARTGDPRPGSPPPFPLQRRF